MTSKQESAEALALEALEWLVGRDDLLPGFLAQSGAAPADLAKGARDPAFLASVLDHVLTDDALVIAFCDARGHAYTRPLQARAWLPGGEATHWT